MLEVIGASFQGLQPRGGPSIAQHLQGLSGLGLVAEVECTQQRVVGCGCIERWILEIMAHVVQQHHGTRVGNERVAQSAPKAVQALSQAGLCARRIRVRPQQSGGRGSGLWPLESQHGQQQCIVTLKGRPAALRQTGGHTKQAEGDARFCIRSGGWQLLRQWVFHP